MTTKGADGDDERSSDETSLEKQRMRPVLAEGRGVGEKLSGEKSRQNDDDDVDSVDPSSSQTEQSKKRQKEKDEKQPVELSGVAAMFEQKMHSFKQHSNDHGMGLQNKGVGERQQIHQSADTGVVKESMDSLKQQSNDHERTVQNDDIVGVAAPRLTRGQRLHQPQPTPGAVRVVGSAPRNNSVVSFYSVDEEELRDPTLFLTEATLFEKPISVAVPAQPADTKSTERSRHSSSQDCWDYIRHRKLKNTAVVFVVLLLLALVVVAVFLVFNMQRQTQSSSDGSDQSSSSQSPSRTIAPTPVPSPSSSNASVAPSSPHVDDEFPILNMSIGEYLRESGLFDSMSTIMARSGTSRLFELSNIFTLLVPIDSDVTSNPFDFKYLSPAWQGHTHRWAMDSILVGKAWRMEELIEAEQVRSVAGTWIRFDNETVQGTRILQPNYARCLNGIIHTTDGLIMPDWLVTERTIRNELQHHFEYWYHLLERLDILDELLSGGESQPKTLFVPSPESMEMFPSDVLNDDTRMEPILRYNFLPDLNFVVQTSLDEVEVERENNTLLLPTAWPGQVIRATPGLFEPLFLINRTVLLNEGVELVAMDVLCIDGVIQVVDGLLLPPSLSNLTVGE